jgi:mannosyltransferase OCH1-like enzyme
MIWLRLTAIGIIVASLICAGVLVSHVLLFVKIFFNHAGIIVSQDEVKAAAAIVTEASDSRTMYIPKIIHQVYHDWKNSSKIPEDWEEMRKTCIDLHMDWEYMVRLLYRQSYFLGGK